MSDLLMPDGQFTALQQAALQLTASADQISQQIAQQKALASIIERIRSSLDLEQIFETTAIEVRQLLKADRVGVFRFTPGSGCDEGEFVAEDVAPGLASAMAARVYDHCFGSQFAAHYIKGRVQAVADIHKANLSDCHVQILQQFQVRANLIVPIIKEQVLWGLVCIHQCHNARHWDPAEIEFAKKIADHFAIALQQAEHLQQIQAQSIELKETIQSLQQSQAQMIQNEKMASLGQLVAGIAHEINNPVNFIYGNLTHVNSYVTDLLSLVSLTQQQQLTPTVATRAKEIDLDFILEDLPKTLSSMKGGADRIRQIVLSLRNFSHLDEAEYKLVDIHEGIESTLLILGHQLQGGEDGGAVEVIKQYADLPLVECYPAQLNQVFMNILVNAIDAITLRQTNPDNRASQPAPRIAISTQLGKPGQVEVRIGDNGIGIRESQKSKIFNHFFTTKPVGKGKGLGLTIAREIIVERHFGTITVDSQPDYGTELIISLPIQLKK